MDQSGPAVGQWQGKLEGGPHQLKLEFTGGGDQTALNFSLHQDK
jgi:hypothetical protein